MQVQIDNKSIEYLAEFIKTNLVVKDYFRTNRIFLCGGSVFDKKTLRYRIQEYFNKRQRNLHQQRYEISYPEDVFDEILMSGKYDLLSLESLLAQSVDLLIIVVESAGSIAELGAFVNDKDLRKKILAINDLSLKKKRSFINQGPIKLLKKTAPSSVLYLDFNDPDFEKLLKYIRTIINRETERSNDLTLLNIDTFILPLLYVTGSLKISAIKEIVKFVITHKDFYEQITFSCLTSMAKRKLIEKKNGFYNLSKLGVDKFNNTMFFRNRDKIDEIRLKYLNLHYRGRSMIS
jgi:hypothetical protein